MPYWKILHELWNFFWMLKVVYYLSVSMYPLVYIYGLYVYLGPSKPEKGTGWSGTTATCIYELRRCECREVNPDPLGEPWASLTAEPSLQSHTCILTCLTNYTWAKLSFSPIAIEIKRIHLKMGSICRSKHWLGNELGNHPASHAGCRVTMCLVAPSLCHRYCCTLSRKLPTVTESLEFHPLRSHQHSWAKFTKSCRSMINKTCKARVKKMIPSESWVRVNSTTPSFIPANHPGLLKQVF